MHVGFLRQPHAGHVVQRRDRCHDQPAIPQRRIPGEGTRDYRDADIRRGRIRMRRALGAFACLDVVADVLALDHEDAILGDVGGVVADALEVACNQD